MFYKTNEKKINKNNVSKEKLIRLATYFSRAWLIYLLKEIVLELNE
jgi:hypothetical protein